MRMKKLHVLVFLASIAPACSKDPADDAKPGANLTGSRVDSGLDAAIVDAGPTAPQINLAVSDPSPHAWTASGDLLPAVSADGATVAILVIKEDGTRMYSNAALEVHNVADDKIVASIPIFVADDIVAAEGMPDAFHTTLPAYKTQAKAKADEANALLGKTKWTALNDRNGNPPQPDGGAPAVTSGAYQVSLVRGSKTLSLNVATTANPSATPITRDVSSMLIAPRKTPKPQKGNPMCRFTPFVGEAAVTPQVVVVRIAQNVEGNVWGCSEPSQWHVYPLSDAPAPDASTK